VAEVEVAAVEEAHSQALPLHQLYQVLEQAQSL